MLPKPGRGEPDEAGGGRETASRGERRHVFFSGRVQGVGFRYTTRNLAARLPVTGFVRNLPDGRVELVAEGSGAEIDRLLATIEGELGQYIRGRQVTVEPATGEFSLFEVAF